MRFKNIIAGTLLSVAVFGSISAVSGSVYAGPSTIVYSSSAKVQGNSNGYYGTGHVSMARKHTVTVKLYYKGTVVKTASDTGTWKVDASTATDTSSSKKSDYDCRTFYTY